MPDDCTGCGVCVDVCPAISKEEVRHKAINMLPKAPHLARERAPTGLLHHDPRAAPLGGQAELGEGLPAARPAVRGVGGMCRVRETPTSSCSASCWATGSSWPTPPDAPRSTAATSPRPRGRWTPGKRPAWANSLFEDNAEFGTGMRLARDAMESDAKLLITGASPRARAAGGRTARRHPGRRSGIAARWVVRLRDLLAGMEGPLPRRLGVADALVRSSVWIVGGDGWAYDIGFGGLDHVLATGATSIC